MLRPSTILAFLAFQRQAIRQIAGTPAAAWPGLLLVLSAGLAREYDGEFLLAEPWHLLIPLAASLLGCLCMVTLVWWLARRRGVRDVTFRTTYLSFLNLYWMTAPLAWLYAIPFERFLSPTGATVANLTLLGIVAVWRVTLMVRSVQVLYAAHWFAALVPVLLFSDVLAMLALYLMPAPVFLIMGGVRLTENEEILLGFRMWTGLVVYGSFLFWLVSYGVLYLRKRRWTWLGGPWPVRPDVAVSTGVWQMAVASVLVWIPLLFLTQPEQALRFQVESMIRQGDYEAAAELTSQNAESAFPPHWDPPPRPAFGETTPAVVDVMAGLTEAGAAAWLLDHYERKLRNEADDYWFHMKVLRYPDERLEKLVDLVEVMDDNEEFLEHFRGLEGMSRNPPHPESRQAIYRRMIELGRSSGEDSR
jgi:hypothetical protein